MDAILPDEQTFVDFGRDGLFPYRREIAHRVRGKNKDALRTAVRQEVPKTPGVYGFVNEDGQLVYVGKSKSLRARLLSYFLPANENEKAGQIAAMASEVLWEELPSEFAALLREQKLISRWQPRYNVVGMPRRQRAAYLCLGRGPAECFYVTSQVDKKARRAEGPFYGMTRLAAVAEILNRVFKLRDCKDKTRFVFSDQLTLFDDPRRPSCLRVELETCLGPCAAACSKGDYEKQIAAAAAFLVAGDDQLVDAIEEKMHAAAAKMHFERAVRLREEWQLMQWINRKLVAGQQARNEYNFIYPVGGAGGLDIWYLIRGGKVEHAVAAPRTKKHWGACRESIQEWFACRSPLTSGYDGGGDTLHIVAAWFRKHRRELDRVKPLANVLASEEHPVDMPLTNTTTAI